MVQSSASPGRRYGACAKLMPRPEWPRGREIHVYNNLWYCLTDVSEQSANLVHAAGLRAVLMAQVQGGTCGAAAQSHSQQPLLGHLSYSPNPSVVHIIHTTAQQAQQNIHLAICSCPAGRVEPHYQEGISWLLCPNRLLAQQTMRTTWPQVNSCMCAAGSPGNSCCFKDAMGASVPDASTTACAEAST